MNTSVNDFRVSKEEVLDLLSYDSGSGVFVWNKHRGGKAKKWSPAGRIDSSGHLQISINGYRHMAHRLAWLVCKGEWPAGLIDHIDGNPSNNVIENLRITDHAENCANRTRPNKNNKTGRLGVHERSESNGFRASIVVCGKRKNLGTFRTKEEAEAAYLAARLNVGTSPGEVTSAIRTTEIAWEVEKLNQEAA